MNLVNEVSNIRRHVVWCVDRSGSMASAGTDAMFLSVQSLVEQAKKIPNTFATIISFDNKIDVVVDKIPVNEVNSDNLRPDQFTPKGQTSLFDAIMLCFEKIEKSSKNDSENNDNINDEKEIIKLEDSFITIITDGQDNSSKASRKDVRERANEMWSKGVQGKFLGAKGYAMRQGEKILGLSSDHILEYEVTEDAVASLSQTLTSSMAHYYTTGTSPAFSPLQRSAATPRRPPHQLLSSRFSSNSSLTESIPQSPRRRHQPAIPDIVQMFGSSPGPTNSLLRTNTDGTFDEADFLRMCRRK
jgi:uncharacterized protein YegL